MKKEFFIHFAFAVSFFVFVSLVRGWISLSYWPLWIGVFIGTILPDIDHLIYIYFLSPYELTSQRVSYMLNKRQVWDSFKLLVETRAERKNLIFHNAGFQLLFIVITFLVVTSSGSIFGTGLVLAFSLHLLVDQLVDITQVGSLENWFAPFKIYLDSQKTKLYIGVISLVILLFGFFL